MVTHGHSVERTFSLFSNSMHFNARIYPYCEMTIYKAVEGEEDIEIILGASDDHVKTKTSLL